jgi:hypothetical protein
MKEPATTTSVNRGEVSFFPSLLNITHPAQGQLFDILTSAKLQAAHGRTISELRSMEYHSEQQKKLKHTLPVVTPHGTFTQRNAASIIAHSGFLSFDIDGQSNDGLNKETAPLYRDKIAKMTDVVMSSLSVSGSGVWGVVKIEHTDYHKQYFSALVRDFCRVGLNIDIVCGDIARARLYSIDTDIKINLNAGFYSTKFITPTIPKPARQNTNNAIPEAAAKYLIDNRPSLECTYQFFLCVFFACRDAFGEAGKQTAIDILTACTTFAASNTAKNVDAVWRSTAGKPTGKAITAGTLVHIAQQAGYRVPTKQTKPAQQITTPSRHSFVMPAPNYGALDEAVPVSPMDEAVPVRPLDEAVPVQALDEAVPVQTLDDTVNQALQAAGWIHTDTETEAEQNDWNNSPGVRWAKQIRQRGTSKNAVPYCERQTARQ